MKQKLVKLLAICFFIVGANMSQSAQAQSIDYFDFWNGETPVVSANGGSWLDIYIYSYSDYNDWWNIWSPYRFSATAKIYYSNGTNVSVPCNLFSSGVELIAPPLPAGCNNYPALQILVRDKEGPYSYNFYGTFIQR